MHIPLTVDASVIDKSYDKPYLHHNKQNLKIQTGLYASDPTKALE
jgi:hypothetical protein